MKLSKKIKKFFEIIFAVLIGNTMSVIVSVFLIILGGFIISPWILNDIKSEAVEINTKNAEYMYNYIQENAEIPKDMELIKLKGKDNMYIKELKCTVEDAPERYIVIALDNGNLDYVLLSNDKLENEQIKQYFLDENIDEMRKFEIGCYPNEKEK